MINRDSVILNPRCAGSVLRYHTWPTIQKQTVADHTFHVLRIYSEVWPEDLLEYPGLVFHVLRHDMSEVATGDIPFPVKRDNPALKQEMDRLENNHAAAMGWSEEDLPVRVKMRVKLCDLCEMYEFGRHELLLGNRFAQPIVEHVSRNIHEIAFGFPDFIPIFNYMNRIPQ